MQRTIGVGLRAPRDLRPARSSSRVRPQSQVFLVAVIVGLVVSIIWPWAIALMVDRRVKDRRKEEIDREVKDQLAQRSRES